MVWCAVYQLVLTWAKYLRAALGCVGYICLFSGSTPEVHQEAQEKVLVFEYQTVSDPDCCLRAEQIMPLTGWGHM